MPGHGQHRRWIVLAASAIALAMFLGGVAAIWQGRSGRVSAAAQPRSQLRAPVTFRPGARPAPAFRLHDLAGTAAVSLSALHGRPVLVTFFDSYCRSVCPVVGGEIASAMRRLPASQRPALVVVSVNPADTRRSVRDAARRYRWSPAWAWHWAAGSHAALAPVWKSYGIDVRPVAGDIEHSEVVYVIDALGNERAAYMPPFRGTDLAADVRTLEQTHGA
jgi:cytochrome oxidase Cu insertion factor (SCO1/SenC/PrrC family)